MGNEIDRQQSIAQTGFIESTEYRSNKHDPINPQVEIYLTDDIPYEISKKNGLIIKDNSESSYDELFEVLFPHLPQNLENLDKFRRSGIVSHNWIYQPWNNTILKLPQENLLFRLVTARNRELITIEEQEKLKQAKVGIIGLSVGQSSALSLAKSCIAWEGGLRLADPDRFQSTNSNRMDAGQDEINDYKTDITGKIILSQRPYYNLEYYPVRIDETNIYEFLNGLDFVVDAFDDIPGKIRLRRIAKELGIPVIMGTDFDEGALMDIEMPDDAIFMGSIPDKELLSIEKNGVPNEMKNIIIPKLLGLEERDITEKLRKHLESMFSKQIPWMTQLGASSDIVGIFTCYVIKRLILHGPQDLKRRSKFLLNNHFLSNESDQFHILDN